MQAAGLFSPLVKQTAAFVDPSSSRATGDFGATLAESISSTAPAIRGDHAPEKTVSGRHDPKLQADALSSQPNDQTPETTTAVSPLSIQIAANPLPFADAAFAILDAPVPATPVENRTDSATVQPGTGTTTEAGAALSASRPAPPLVPNSFSFADLTPAPRPDTAHSKTEITLASEQEPDHGAATPPIERVPAPPTVSNPVIPADHGPKVPEAGAHELQVITFAAPRLKPANPVALPLHASEKEVPIPIDAVQSTFDQATVSQPSGVVLQRSVVDDYRATSSVSQNVAGQPVPTAAPDSVAITVSADVPGTIDTTSQKALPQFNIPISPDIATSIATAIPQQAPTAASPDVHPTSGTTTTGTKNSAPQSSAVVSLESAVATSALLANDANSATISASQQVFLATPAESVPIAASASGSAPGRTTFNAAPDKAKSSASAAIATDIRSAASSAVQAHGQLFADSLIDNKASRAVSIDPVVTSKAVAEKKASVPSPQAATASHEAPPALISESGTTVVVPRAAASDAPPRTTSAEVREAPRAPHLPESAPPAASTAASARIVADAAGEMQMRVGIRTTAFGAVEIYTSIHQNQVGLSVHGERGMEHWFSTEVQSIETGLKDHHLHLTTMEMDKGGTGLQTSTGSQQQSQRHFSTTSGWQNYRSEKGAAETTALESTAALPAWSGANRVSIHV